MGIMSLKLPIVIIGPMCVGKTTVSKLVSRKLSIPYCSLDSVRWYYYLKSGMDILEDDINKEKSFEELLRSRSEYDTTVVERVFSDFKNYVLDFGISHAFQENAHNKDKLSAIVQKNRNSFLLIPSTDVEVSASILNERLKEFRNSPDIEDIMQFNIKTIETFLETYTNSKVLFTKDKTPKQVSQELIDSLFYKGT